MSRGISIAMVVMLCLLAASCHHPDDPPPPSGPEPGKRDYTWTIDTLSYPGSFQTLMYGIWASSPKDVYVVGHNDQASVAVMYHFDGAHWTPVKLHPSVGGNINAGFTLSKVFGLSPSNVWAIGTHIYDNPAPPPNFLDSSIIIHFDGTAWREESILKGRQMLGIGGASANDLWAAGAKGTLYHFDGEDWSKQANVNTTLDYSQFAAFAVNDVYMTTGRSLAGPDTIGDFAFYLNHWDGASWSVVDSSSTVGNTTRFAATIWGSSSHALYSSYLGVTKTDGSGDWEYMLRTELPVAVTGSSDNNIYAVSDGWNIHHWNGADWQLVSNPFRGSGYWTCAWTNNHETFIVGMDGRRTYIMHGK